MVIFYNLEYLGTYSSPDEIQVISVIMGPSCYNPWNMENQGTNRDIAFLLNFGGVTNKSSLLLPQVHRHDFQLHFDHIGLHQLVQRQLLAHLRWGRHRCHHLVWCVGSCYIFYIFLVCISCGIFMVQCCTLLNIFGASYLLYIFGALYLVLGLFFDANITFFGIVCFVKCALCCILLLVQCTHILMWPRSCLERWLPCCLYLS